MGISQVHHYDANGAGLATLAVTSQSAGNYLTVGWVGAFGAADRHITAITGGGVTTWTSIKSLTGTATQYNNAIWGGVVTSASASSLGLTYSASITATCYINCEEFSFADAAAQWTVVSSASATTTTSTNMLYPTLTSPASGQSLYYGWGGDFSGASGLSGAGTGTSGDAMTYKVDGGGNDYCYGVNLTASTSEKPVGKLSAAVTSRSLGVILSVLHPKTLTPTSARGSPTVAKQDNKLLNPTDPTASVSATKQTGKRLDPTDVTGTAVVVKQDGKRLTPTPATGSASATKQDGKRLTPTPATGSASATEQAGKNLGPSATGSASLTKRTGKLLSAAANAVAVRVASAARTFSATATAVAVRVVSADVLTLTGTTPDSLVLSAATDSVLAVSAASDDTLLVVAQTGSALALSAESGGTLTLTPEEDQ